MIISHPYLCPIFHVPAVEAEWAAVGGVVPPLLPARVPAAAHEEATLLLPLSHSVGGQAEGLVPRADLRGEVGVGEVVVLVVQYAVVALQSRARGGVVRLRGCVRRQVAHGLCICDILYHMCVDRA